MTIRRRSKRGCEPFGSVVRNQTHGLPPVGFFVGDER